MRLQIEVNSSFGWSVARGSWIEEIYDNTFVTKDVAQAFHIIEFSYDCNDIDTGVIALPCLKKRFHFVIGSDGLWHHNHEFYKTVTDGEVVSDGSFWSIRLSEYYEDIF